ncbi:MAG: c-type cytochrome [Bacteroidota bacterium]
MRLNKIVLFLTALLLVTKLSFADVAEGEKLFNANCTACHAINDKVVGPALKDIDKRQSEAWLIKWVKNSQAVIKSGDAYANKIYNEYNQSQMTAFPQLSDDQIKSILAYVKTGGPAPAAATAGAEGGAAPANGDGGFYTQGMLIGLSIFAVILIAIIFILVNIRKVIENIYNEKHPEMAEEPKIHWKQNKKAIRYKLFVKHPVVGTLAVGAVITIVLGLYGFDFANKEVGVQKGYAPTQPINYSHELHAGKYKINCQYCHSSADKSKQASIPSASTCMNCHMYVKAKDKYNGQVSPEIQKIYNAVGYDAEKGAYIAGFKQQPIKWIRIHNLPDHAYFNHSQHVKIGKVECQACHGPIEKMKVVSQQRSLQMGWCINCHREAKVDVANNDYYEKLHKDLKASNKDFITVAQNGGLECAKCHY